MKYTAPMTHGPIWKKITLFALPVLVGTLFQQLYSTIDSLIVGNYLGSAALAAVSSTDALLFMLIGFVAGGSVGAGVVVARYFGARKIAHMKSAIYTTIILGLIMGVFLTVVGILITPKLLVWISTPDDVMEDSLVYLRIYFAGSVGLVMYNVLLGILQALGDSKHPLYYLLVCSVINVVLDLLFIVQFGWGVGGAAFATIISQFVSAVLCFLQLLYTKEIYHIRIRDIKPDLKIVKEIVRMGLPAGCQNSIIGFANVIVQNYINIFGALVMAGCGAYIKIEGFVFLPISSYSMALTTFVGQNLGAGEFDRIKRGARFGIITSAVVSQLLAVIFLIYSEPLFAIFDPNPEVIAAGTLKMRICAPFFFALSYSYSIGGIVRGAGKSMVPTVIMVTCWCVIRIIILLAVVPATHNIVHVHALYSITWLISSLMSAAYYYFGRWLPDYNRDSKLTA